MSSGSEPVENVSKREIRRFIEDHKKKSPSNSRSARPTVNTKKLKKCLKNCVLSLDSDEKVYISGDTLLLMQGVITPEEYYTGVYKEPIPKKYLDFRLCMKNVLGAMRGITRLRFNEDKNIVPSSTMKELMKKEDEEFVASGGVFMSDIDSETENTHKQSNPDTTKGDSQNPTLEKPRNSETNQPGCKSSSQKSSKHRSASTDSNQSPSSINDQDQDSTLPDELLQCGECGISITSLQHLDRHLERCRRTSRRKIEFSTKQSQGVSSKTSDNSKSTPGKLETRDSPDGPVIEGWSPNNKKIPRGPICPRCAYEVPTLFDLPLHQRFHTERKELTCPVCVFSTELLSVYLSHIEDHTFN